MVSVTTYKLGMQPQKQKPPLSASDAVVHPLNQSGNNFKFCFIKLIKYQYIFPIIANIWLL